MKLCGDPVGGERLIFLMKVTGVVSIAEYYETFPLKIPVDPDHCNNQTLAVGRVGCRAAPAIQNTAIDYRLVVGDNIYRPLNRNPLDWYDYELLPNRHHTTDEQRKIDISGEKVLISAKGNFYYFGGQYLHIDKAFRPNVPRGQARYGACSEGEILPLIQHIQKRFPLPGIHGAPLQWRTGDATWKNDENYIQP